MYNTTYPQLSKFSSLYTYSTYSPAAWGGGGLRLASVLDHTSPFTVCLMFIYMVVPGVVVSPRGGLFFFL